MGLLDTAAAVKRGKLKLADVPEGRRKKVQRLLDDYGKELDAMGRSTSGSSVVGIQSHVRAARTA